ncbi:CLUMA_CG008526, isoform A [Clunio marinus]|uniref:CLUMA_CG008526, isoform A n=1 Tax=Clunio marinus TaxID=568069 RepID=A0A1J1I4C3_9DIPT|nr:CLUMA_CG008526, isoform A [Clunio marinus]
MRMSRGKNSFEKLIDFYESPIVLLHYHIMNFQHHQTISGLMYINNADLLKELTFNQHNFNATDFSSTYETLNV